MTTPRGRGHCLYESISEYGNVYGNVRALIIGILFALPLYEKVCFSASNYMNGPSFHSSHYFNSPLDLQFRH